jgi:hypothetical protein
VQHEYESKQKDFNKDETVLTTCNQFQPAQYNPEKFQPVELADEEVNIIQGPQ